MHEDQNAHTGSDEQQAQTIEGDNNVASGEIMNNGVSPRIVSAVSAAAIGIVGVAFDAEAGQKDSIGESVRDVTQSQMASLEAAQALAPEMQKLGIDYATFEMVSRWDAERTFKNKLLEDSYPKRDGQVPDAYEISKREALAKIYPVLTMLEKSTNIKPMKGENLTQYLARALKAQGLQQKK